MDVRITELNTMVATLRYIPISAHRIEDDGFVGFVSGDLELHISEHLS
jgi:hypothetical protein